MKCKDTFLGNGDKVADCDFFVILFYALVRFRVTPVLLSQYLRNSIRNDNWQINFLREQWLGQEIFGCFFLNQHNFLFDGLFPFVNK